MRPFEYVSPANVDEASALLGPKWGENEILAGGTDLLSLMKDEVVTPKRLVNIKQMQTVISRDAFRGFHLLQFGELSIGALARLQDVADNDLVRKAYPALAEACAGAASPQIRNLATIGGNLCQRPRCWYFRNGFGLLAMKDGKSLVEEGDNRYHAILGNQGPAKFVSPSSIVPVLIAYGAEVVISSSDRNKGRSGYHNESRPRTVPLDKFFITPKEEGEREHDLAANEVITAIILESTNPDDINHGFDAHYIACCCANYEIRQKYSFDWPLATAAVRLKIDRGKLFSPVTDAVIEARIVIGHVAPVPWVSAEAERVLKGKAITEEAASAAADAALAKATPLSRNGYKVQLASVAIKRAILAASKNMPT
jgi:xanthine dehydrogenase YagS FAD-binding subunit